MAQPAQIANLKNLPDSLWKYVLEFADNNAASAVCRVLRGCQGSLINQLWRSFNFNSPLIHGWLNQNTIFGNKPRLLNRSPSGDERLQLARLLRSGMQRLPNSAPIHPISFEAIAQTNNDRNLVAMFPSLEKALVRVRHLLPADLDEVFKEPEIEPENEEEPIDDGVINFDVLDEKPKHPDQIREWIRRATEALKERFPEGEALLIFDFSNLGLTAIPKEFALFKPFMANARFAHNKLSFIPQGFFSDCPHLLGLSFRNNLLRNLPSDFVSNCPRLTILALSKNRLEEIPSDVLSDCPSLTSIVLNDNRLNRLPLRFLSNSPNLGFRDLRNNQLAGQGLTIELGIVPGLMGRIARSVGRNLYIMSEMGSVKRLVCYGTSLGLSCIVSHLISSQIPFWAIPVTSVIGCLGCEYLIQGNFGDSF